MDNINSILSTLGQEGVDKYYVYALCDKRNHIPFYIGKGQGDRMWQHEKGYAEELKNNASSDIDSLKKELSAKHMKIQELGENVEKIIIKWGLTEDEAFMAESALINLLNYTQGVLTNIVNGHASQKEKTSLIHSTAAMNEVEFYNLCCKPEVIYTDIKYNCLFININVLYPECLKEPIKKRPWAIKETTRGCWVVGQSRKNPEYLFAVYQSRICGIYRVLERRNNLDLKDFPQFPKDIRREEMLCIEKIVANGTPEDYSVLDEKAKECFVDYSNKYNATVRNNIKKGITIDYKKEYDNWKKRYYFICEECTDKNLIELLGCVVQQRDGGSIFGSGNPLSYNY